MLDYIIVGSGLAGIAFAETALRHQQKILIFDAGFPNSSEAAAGIYNPVTLKRFTGLQDAMMQLDEMNAFYDELEFKLSIKVRHPMPIWRRFASVEEQNNWYAAAERPSMGSFLSPSFISESQRGINGPFGFGKVNHTGFVDTAAMLQVYRLFLQKDGLLTKQPFDHSQLTISMSRIIYRQYSARHIVFAEGYDLLSNPWFNYLPLTGTKGELLTVRVPGLDLRSIVKAGVFIVPLGNDLYRVGATYDWDDKTNIITETARKEIINSLKEILVMPFEIVDQKAGIRPTVKDRKPLVGTHHKNHNLHILNGLGTRGVMLGPYMANRLFESIEKGMPLDRPYNIRRFDAYLPASGS